MTGETGRVIAVSVAKARTVPWHGDVVRTGIYKVPTSEPVRVRRLGLEGDEQADLEVHGGPLKAVYAYPSEHYAFWREELPEIGLPWGAFGENLTTAGLAEERVHVGDRFGIGSAVLAVTRPRFPCYKLAVKFGREDIIGRFLASGRTGFYLRVLEEGSLREGDAIAPLGGEPGQATIAQLAAERRRIEGA